MAKEEETLLERLQTKVRQLIQQYQKLQQRNATLKQNLEQCEAKNTELESKVRELSAQYADLKIAKTMELSEGDTRAAHRRFASLVRQVDECIALLKS